MPFIRQHLERAQQRMENQANKHRSEREFAVGDQVYLKLQPYVQTSVARRPSHKLGFKYFGPYTILKKVGKVAYKLQLPATSKIHPVVHVSQLKRAIGPQDRVSTYFPMSLMHSFLVQPEKILQERVIRRGSKETPQVRVQWTSLPDDCTTWEGLYSLVNQYPQAPAWGQAAVSAGCIVTHLHLPKALRVKRRTDARQVIREQHLTAKRTLEEASDQGMASMGSTQD
jgi:hypothetical protein